MIHTCRSCVCAAAAGDSPVAGGAADREGPATQTLGAAAGAAGGGQTQTDSQTDGQTEGQWYPSEHRDRSLFSSGVAN